MQVRHYPPNQFEAHKCGTPNTVMMRIKVIDLQINVLKRERKRVLEKCIGPDCLVSSDRSVITDHGKVRFLPENINHRLDIPHLIGVDKDKSTVDERRGGELVKLVPESDWPHYWASTVVAPHFRFYPSTATI